MLGSSAVECLTQEGYATRDARYKLDFYISSITKIERELRTELIAKIHSLHEAATKFAAFFQAVDTRRPSYELLGARIQGETLRSALGAWPGKIWISSCHSRRLSNC